MDEATNKAPSAAVPEGLPTGNRVLMRGDHPWSGFSGTVDRWEKSPFGVAPVIKLDNGMECFATKPEDFVVLNPGQSAHETRPARGRRRNRP